MIMGAIDRFLKRGRVQDFSRGPIAKMLSELRKFGANGHLYIPGVGAISGITAGNYLDSIGTTSASVDGNVGLVKDQLGSLNATQSTTGYQPKLRRGIVNLLTQSDFQNGLTDAPARGGLITLSSIDAKNALAFGYDGATASYGYKAYSSAAGSSNTVAVLLKMDSGNAPVFGSATLASPLNDFLLKASSSELPALTYTIASVGSGLYVVAATGVATGSQVGIVKYANNSTNTFKVTSYGLFKGTITAQQILAAGGIPVTTTAPASSSAGAYKWEFDGTDDFMSLVSVPFNMADDHYSAVALTPNAINTGKHILNPANGAASQQVGNISVDGNSKFITIWCDDATNVLGVADAVTVAPGVASVLASRRVGTTGVMRKNGAQVGSISLASLGATTLTLPGVIGSYKAGANPSAISLHGVAVIKGTVTDAQALIFERGLNALSQYAVGRF